MNKRMYWIRNIEEIEQGAKTYWVEYELGSESEIDGVLDYANGSILCSRLTLELDDKRLFKYLLRLRVPESSPDMTIPKASRKGYLLKGGLVEELVSILSLALETRFFILSRATGELGPIGIKLRNEYSPVHRPCTRIIDPVIVSTRKRNFRKDVPPLLRLITSVKAEYHQQLILAYHHYAKALREVAIDDEMVFIRLVSSIEVVARDISLHRKMDTLACRTLLEIVREESLSPEEYREAKKLFENRYSRSRFRTYLGTYSKGFFRGGKWKAPHTRIMRFDLDRVASRIYDARSSYLHSGQPMYLSLRIRGEQRWHTDPSMGMVIGDRKFSDSEKLPYTYWFHQLVRHCLLNYTKYLSQSSDVTPSKGPSQ